MKKAKRWSSIAAALLVLAIAQQIEAGAPFKKVSIAPASKTSTTTTPSLAAAEESNSDESSTAEVKVEEQKPEATPKPNSRESKLTGIPQIDYIWDPNLPRELRGYNLSTYPFLSTTPQDDEIHFKCDGLHDGFYASIEYKCQLYHHCVYGIRHDFLCANFTAFDQKTFICHFASDVDCEGSTKYWNRNDALYMATTTTSTTTTTTEPPPTQRRRPVRPQRPLRRPGSRRPIDDYYDEEEYDEDYYEERLNKRRKHRPRQRKPVVDYEDEEYEDEKRSLADETPRRPISRNRFRDEVDAEDDYDFDRPKSKTRNKPTPAAERRKISSRKPGGFSSGRANPDERRSFNDDRPAAGGRRKPVVPPVDDVEDTEELPPRRQAGRKRINEKRSSSTAAPDLDDLDEYEKPNSKIPDQEEAAAGDDAPPKVKTTPKPLEEFITPKAASASSVYARPRAPPRIARPVPINEKSKFKYPIQKTATTSAPPLGAEADDDYYAEDDEYDVKPRGPSKKRIAVDDLLSDEDDDLPPRRSAINRKPTRTLRKPLTGKKVIDDEEDYDLDRDRFDGRGGSRRRNPLTGRTRGRHSQDDVDFVDDDYDERPAKRARPQTSARKGLLKKQKLPEPSEEIVEEEEPEIDTKPLKSRGQAATVRRKPLPASPIRSRNPAPQADALSSGNKELEDSSAPADESILEETEPSSKASLPTSRPASVRVVKRPFLPSRGGSPYLPRGLQPVGQAHGKHQAESHATTDSSTMDILSTMSGVHLLEHGAPLLRGTTLPPRSPIPTSKPRPESVQSNKATLDELYENDYDVTLNDALNPTLKPLSPHQSSHHYHHQHNHVDNINNNNNNNRPYQSYYDIRRRTVISSSSSQSNRQTGTSRVAAPPQPTYYDEYEY
uniref:Chitin-binding type-2 domain-containing protein n=1 Tax=Stomoxys calcitrans TaxID=35570 RepID=A0A1I8P040_STOCA